MLLRRSLEFSRKTAKCRVLAAIRVAQLSSSALHRSNKFLHDGDLKPVRSLFDLKDRNYIVTGGGRGIGYAITRAIAEMGGNVAVLDILDSPVKDFGTLEGDFGVKARYFHADVTQEESLTRGFEQSIAELGSLDGWYENRRFPGSG